jgi:hypothetical protein
MSVDTARREDWIMGGLALLLVIDLLGLPWYTAGGGTISGISLPSISNTATGSPSGFLGVLAVLAALGILLDLVFAHLSPGTEVPAIGGNRSLTRRALAIAAAGMLALKFLLHLGAIGNLAVGFWLGAVLAGGLVFATSWARREEPPRAGRSENEPADTPPRGAS